MQVDGEQERVEDRALHVRRKRRAGSLVRVPERELACRVVAVNHLGPRLRLPNRRTLVDPEVGRGAPRLVREKARSRSCPAPCPCRPSSVCCPPTRTGEKATTTMRHDATNPARTRRPADRGSGMVWRDCVAMPTQRPVMPMQSRWSRCVRSRAPRCSRLASASASAGRLAIHRIDRPLEPRVGPGPPATP